MDAVEQLNNYSTPLMDGKRMIFMSLNVFLLCLSVILFIVAMTAWSTDEENVLRTYWAYSESATENQLVTMYGLRSIVVGDLNNDDTSGHTTYSDCNDADYCENCETAGKTALAMCLLAFFSLCPLVVTTGLRIMKFLDNKLLKLSSIFLTASALFWSIIAVWNWSGGCVDFLPVMIGTTGYKYGPGYNCVVCNIFWLLISLYVHICTSGNIASDASKSEPLTNQEGGEDHGDGYVPAPDGGEEMEKNEI